MPFASPHWSEWAACLREDPELFFPIGEAGPGFEQAELAKRVCRSCPVARECLDYALETGQDAGVWGGTTPPERRQLRGSRL